MGGVRSWPYLDCQDCVEFFPTLSSSAVQMTLPTLFFILCLMRCILSLSMDQNVKVDRLVSRRLSARDLDSGHDHFELSFYHINDVHA